MCSAISSLHLVALYVHVCAVVDFNVNFIVDFINVVFMSVPNRRCFGLTRRGSNQSKTKTTLFKVRHGDIYEFSCDTFVLYSPATNDEQVIMCRLGIYNSCNYKRHHHQRFLTLISALTILYTVKTVQ